MFRGAAAHKKRTAVPAHFFVVGPAGASPRRRRSTIMFVGMTTKQ
jgi:hypothetical protein